MNSAIGFHLSENPTHSLTLNCRDGEWYATIYQYGGMFLFTSGPADCPSMAMEQLSEDIEQQQHNDRVMEDLYLRGTLVPS
jgi:hypothetical protein